MIAVALLALSFIRSKTNIYKAGTHIPAFTERVRFVASSSSKLATAHWMRTGKLSVQTCE